jgi:inorganic pyrophosphatase
MKFPPPFAKDEESVHVIIETPQGSRHKFDYDPETEMFQLKKTLPGGTAFPLEMGFIPGTKGEDGDPLDVLVISEQPCFPGCLIECRILGIIEAEQTGKDKKTNRNDRILAVSSCSHDFSNIKSIDDVEKDRIEDIARFFKYYNKVEKKKFELLGIKGPKKALQLIKKQIV